MFSKYEYKVIKYGTTQEWRTDYKFFGILIYRIRAAR